MTEEEFSGMDDFKKAAFLWAYGKPIGRLESKVEIKDLYYTEDIFVEIIFCKTESRITSLTVVSPMDEAMRKYMKTSVLIRDEDLKKHSFSKN